MAILQLRALTSVPFGSALNSEPRSRRRYSWIIIMFARRGPDTKTPTCDPRFKEYAFICIPGNGVFNTALFVASQNGASCSWSSKFIFSIGSHQGFKCCLPRRITCKIFSGVVFGCTLGLLDLLDTGFTVGLVGIEGQRVWGGDCRMHGWERISTTESQT
jgi:hypothetical protein